MATSPNAKLSRLMSVLPEYCTDYFVSKDTIYQPKTKVAYAMDLQVFFHFLLDAYPDEFSYDSIRKIPVSALGRLKSNHIANFLFYLTDYSLVDENGMTQNYKNSESGKKRKLATLKAFYRYLNVNNLIDNDPTVYIDVPKIRNKPIVALNEKEQSRLQNAAISGKGKTERALKFHEHTQFRDLSILLMFLGTGVRVSELANMNLYDIDFDEQRILVVRKGGNKEFVYFGKEVLSSLIDYIDIERPNLGKGKVDLDADGPLFISNRGTRMSVDRIEKIIKEIAASELPANLKVTCHTLRKTYGSILYEKYGDLLLVQHALGHSNSSTTSKYYTKFNPDRMKKLTGYKIQNAE